jgi:hypothetical protein
VLRSTGQITRQETDLFITHHTGDRTLIIPMSSVVRAEGGQKGYAVIDRLGEKHNVSSVAWEMAVDGTPGGTLPAQPGTYLIWHTEEEDGSHGVMKSTVVGWSLTPEGLPKPLVVDPEALLSNGPWQVLQPDGRVERSDGTQWSDASAWLAHVQKYEKPGEG